VVAVRTESDVWLLTFALGLAISTRWVHCSLARFVLLLFMAYHIPPLWQASGTYILPSHSAYRFQSRRFWSKGLGPVRTREETLLQASFLIPMSFHLSKFEREASYAPQSAVRQAPCSEAVADEGTERLM
jgi:hypothetical protein